MSEQPMALVIEFRSRPKLRAAALALVAVTAAGCADSDRFFDSPLANNAPGQPEAAGPGSRGQLAAPAGRVQSAQLPPPGAGRPMPLEASAGVAGGSRGMASYNP